MTRSADAAGWMKAEAGKAGRFAVVGALATLVHTTVSLGLLQSGMLQAFPANVAGFLVAFCFSFAGHHFWSFAEPNGHSRTTHRMRRFFIIALAGFMVNSGVLTAWLALTPWPESIGLVVAIAIVPGLSFLGARLWAFSAPSRTS
ncbi:hypothetical protein GCM10011316_36880 [Roseibium aquae]|uniref:GtrA/DPMS transmembrane domain-containing protein n=1 Tax=Roseibium aquae TaxID=1323746 RepID=A0A916X224_9HYPH|nr:GtrA family protein [Roseibium aquae]GGB61528.1 hypothetical protein GCM10011316_36880 [Roseibium aquae]